MQKAARSHERNAAIFEIKRVHYLSHRHLFDDALVESWRQANGLDLYNIYFITVAKKYRFDLTRTSANVLGQLKTYVKVGDTRLQRVVTHVHKCNSTLFHAFHRASPFGEVGTEFRIDRAASDDKTLIIKVKLRSIANPVSLPLLVENVLEAADCRLGIDGAPRIVYIGQSFRILERLRTHERINETSANLRDDEELHVSLVQFRIGYLGKYLDEGWKFFISQNDSTTQTGIEAAPGA